MALPVPHLPGMRKVNCRGRILHIGDSTSGCLYGLVGKLAHLITEGTIYTTRASLLNKPQTTFRTAHKRSRDTLNDVINGVIAHPGGRGWFGALVRGCRSE